MADTIRKFDSRSNVGLRKFSSPDKDTFEFLFIRSKFGFLRIAQLIFTLISWILTLHFKNNVKGEDSETIALFLFASIFAWLYSIFSLALSLIVMRKRSHDLVRRITLICCCMTSSVFCFVASSLLADYVRRLANHASFCDTIEIASCEEIQASVVFGYFAVACFLADAGYELYILNRIKDSALLSHNRCKDGNAK